MQTLRTALTAAAAVLATGFLAGGARAANILVNGSFEAPSIGSGNYSYAANAASGWTFSGAALVNGQGSSAWYGGSAPSGMDGVQFAALQGAGTMSQSFTATASTLHLGWLDAGRPAYGCCNGDQSYNVLLDGVAVGGTFSTVSGTSFDFNTVDLTGLTVGSAHTLSFQGLVAADQTAFIDGVQLSATSLVLPATPPTKTIFGADLPLPGGEAMIDDFDGFLAAGFTFTGGYTRSGALGLDPNVSAPPPGDVTGYETLVGGVQAVLTAPRLLKTFSFYMGSPDTYNSIRFLGPNYDFTLKGAELWLPQPGGGAGDQSWGYRVKYDFGGHGVDKIIFSSTGNSFEFDDLAGTLQGVPEPATWAMMLLGFFGLGSMLRSRRGALTPSV